VKSLVIPVVLLTLLTAVVEADEKAPCPPPEAGLEVGFFSAYVSRGQVNNDEPVVQPSLTAAKGPFSINVWGNFNLTHRITDQNDFSEIDLTAAYALPVKFADIEVGLAEYVFPHTELEIKEETESGVETRREAAPGTREVFIGIGVPDLFITPHVCAYYDFDEANGAYIEGSLEKEFTLGTKGTLTPGFSTGYGTDKYNDYFFGVDENKLNDGNVYLNARYPVNDALAISANLTYMWLWDSNIRDGAEETYFDTKSLFGGVTMIYNF
jgi:hypothetical protein